MIVIEGFQSAKSTLSRRAPAEFYPVSPALSRRLREVFGAEIEPEPAVRQIIDEVREKGDTALLDFTLKIDGVAEDEKTVTVAPDESTTISFDTPTT